MEYTLPHAVLALLKEEEASPIPKSYVIRSGSRSTKITLIYSKRKRAAGDFVQNSRESCPFNFNEHQSESKRKKYNDMSRSTATPPRTLDNRLSTGSNDPRSHSLFRCPTDTSNTSSVFSSNSSTTISSRCARSELGRSRDRYECQSSPNDDDGVEEDEKDNDQAADEYSDNFITLSPSCYGDDDKPLTPGRDFNPSESPRPITPTLNHHYEPFKPSPSSSSLNHTAMTKAATPSRQPTIEYDGSLSPPSIMVTKETDNPQILRDNPEMVDTDETPNLTESREQSQHQQQLLYSINATPTRSHKTSSRRSSSKTPRTDSRCSNKSNSKSSSCNSGSNGGSGSHGRKGRQSASPATRTVPPITIQITSPERRAEQQQPQQQQQQMRIRHDACALATVTTQHKVQGRSLHRLSSWDGGRR